MIQILLFHLLIHFRDIRLCRACFDLPKSGKASKYGSRVGKLLD
jgi:hypothetical protein